MDASLLSQQTDTFLDSVVTPNTIQNVWAIKLHEDLQRIETDLETLEAIPELGGLEASSLVHLRERFEKLDCMVWKCDTM